MKNAKINTETLCAIFLVPFGEKYHFSTILVHKLYRMKAKRAKAKESFQREMRSATVMEKCSEKSGFSHSESKHAEHEQANTVNLIAVHCVAHRNLDHNTENHHMVSWKTGALLL